MTAWRHPVFPSLPFTNTLTTNHQPKGVRITCISFNWYLQNYLSSRCHALQIKLHRSEKSQQFMHSSRILLKLLWWILKDSFNFCHRLKVFLLIANLMERIVTILLKFGNLVDQYTIFLGNYRHRLPKRTLTKLFPIYLSKGMNQVINSFLCRLKKLEYLPGTCFQELRRLQSPGKENLPIADHSPLKKGVQEYNVCYRQPI